MAVNAETRKPVLSTVTGGLSGPAIKPVALRMVWKVYKAVKIPLFGIGGIMNATDAIEFILAGSSAVQVGTANFIDPLISLKIIKGIEEYLDRHGIESVTELIGGLEA
jgi:dihydroorotate dehydrogenase (NAD+) catalytic subunit